MKAENLEDLYELAPIQQGILFHSLLNPNHGMYVVQMSLTLRGSINRDAFQKAWATVMQRHSILRTAFLWEGLTKPVQMVIRQVKVPLVELDWRDRPAAQQQANLESLLQQDQAQGFDLTQAPLMRLTLIQFADDVHQLIWSKHHLILDGWSTGIVLKEVFLSYEAFCQEAGLTLPPSQPYRNYIAWWQEQDLVAAEQFWREHLQGFTTPTPLSIDDRSSASTTVSTTEYTSEELILDRNSTVILQSFARQHQLTLNTLVQAAWALLLSRYSGETDVVFGSTSAGRPPRLSGSDSMVGVFINTLPVRVQVEPETSLLPWLQQLQTQFAIIRQYEYSPLAQVQGWSEIPRGTPLFDSIVVFENYPIDPALQQQNRRSSIANVQSYERTNYPLTLIAMLDPESAPGSLLLKVLYDGQRFESAAIVRLLGHLQALLSRMVANPQPVLAQLSPITPTEQQQLLEWGQITQTFPQSPCVPQWFEAQVEQTPDAIAITHENQHFTYWELNEKANQLAHLLRQKGVQSNTLVALCCERSFDMIVAILGVLKAGGAYVPLDPRYPTERLAYLLNDAKPAVLVTHQATANCLPATTIPTICLDESQTELQQAPTTNPACISQPNHLAYVIYTSGSTGTPKGVLVRHGQMMRLFKATQNWFQFNHQDVWTLFHSYAFDFSVWEIWGALLHGGRLVIVPYEVTRSPAAFHTLLQTQHVTVLNQTPSAFRQLIWADATQTDTTFHLRYIIFGGEALDLQSLKPWYDRYGDQMPQLINMYGITETTVHVTYRPLNRADLAASPSLSPIGRPIPDLQIYVLDAQQQFVPIGIPGELYVGGAGVSLGYLNRPALTAERFIPDPLDAKSRLYRTGDRVRWLANGELEYLGRFDNQIKLRGFRIELGEIETALGQHPAVREAVVLLREDQLSDPRLVAYIVSDPSQPEPSDGELRGFLQQQLPDYMIPAAWVNLDALPLTANGKLDRQQLPAPTHDRPSLKTSFLRPQTELEQTIAAIWQRVLKIDKVGIHDSFFDLGGNSLLLVQMHSHLQDSLETSIALIDLFRYPTIHALANFLNQSKPDSSVLESTRSTQLEQGKTRRKQRLKQRKHKVNH
jgi:amino acid adenylation domain-containing protein